MNDYFDELFETGEMTETFEPGVVYEHFGAEHEMISEQPDAEVYGDYAVDAAAWEHADNPNLDSLFCEKYIADVFELNDFSVEHPELNGYHPEYGTTLENVGKNLEIDGLQVERETQSSIKDVCESIDCGEKVICAVSSVALYFPELASMPGLSADSFVEVIGVDCTDSENQSVIVNVPAEDHAASSFPMDVFSNAWEVGNRYCVIVGKE